MRLHPATVLSLSTLLCLPLLSGCSVPPPQNIGVVDNHLHPCPQTPNCVSSEAAASDAEHVIAPLRYAGSAEQARARLEQLLGSQPRVRLVTATPTYLHAEFTTRLLRFVDDVEFLFVTPGRIEVRSASRVGRSDMGVNRERVEALRRQFSG